MEVYTIGFTQKPAERFFRTLKDAGVRRLVDVRLHNTSQLASFAKRDDLSFFLWELCGAGYIHEPLLAPTKEILDTYRRDGDWMTYERAFLELLRQRGVESRLDRASFREPTVLLCSEPTPDRCHRRLAAEYLGRCWGDVTVIHL